MERLGDMTQQCDNAIELTSLMSLYLHLPFHHTEYITSCHAIGQRTVSVHHVSPGATNKRANILKSSRYLQHRIRELRKEDKNGLQVL